MLFKKNKKPGNSRNLESEYKKGSSSIYTYRANRSDNKGNVGRNPMPDTPQPKKQKGGAVNLIITVLVGIVIIASIIYSITLSTTPKVKLIGDTNQSFVHPTSVYQQAAQKILNSSALDQYKVTINVTSIENKLKAEFPELSGVSVVIPLAGHTPLIEIEPSQSVVVLQNSQGKFVISEQGYVIAKLSGTEESNLPVVSDQSGIQYTLGKQVVTSDTVGFINEVSNQLAAKNIPIQSITLSQTPYELDVQARGQPYYIKFDLLNDVDFQIGTYLAVIQQLSSQKTTPSKYIDVRIPGHAYYM